MEIKTLKEFYGKKENYSKEELLNYINEFYNPTVLNNFEELLKIQNMSVGKFGINTIEDYTDGYIKDGNLLLLVFKDKKDFMHISYKDEDFFTEAILKFNDNDVLIDFFINGDDLPLQYSLVEVFEENRNNTR